MDLVSVDGFYLKGLCLAMCIECFLVYVTSSHTLIDAAQALFAPLLG